MSMKTWWTKSRIIGISLITAVGATIGGLAINDFVKMNRISLNNGEKGEQILSDKKFTDPFNAFINTDTTLKFNELSDKVAGLVTPKIIEEILGDNKNWISMTKTKTLIYTYWDAKNTKYDDGINDNMDDEDKTYEETLTAVTEKFQSEIKNHVVNYFGKENRKMVLTSAKTHKDWDKNWDKDNVSIDDVFTNAEKVLFGDDYVPIDLTDWFSRWKELMKKFKK